MPDTPTRLKAFLTHSSADTEICDQLATALRGAGADVWYDDHKLGAGQLLEEIEREFNGRPVCIVLLSKHAPASPWVTRETTWAFNLASREPNRLILPLTVGAIEARDMPPHPHVEMVSQTLRLLVLTPQGSVAVTPQPAEGLSDLLTQGKALQAQQKPAEVLPFFQRATQADPNSFDA
jgi:hypothetical protein